jgi:hypothetical protein
MTKTARLNLSDAVDDLAPPPPPCWPDRTSWMEYLKSAAAAQNKHGNPRVILTAAEGPAFNTAFNFCTDCLSSRAARMTREGKCQPDALKTKDQTPA